MAANSTATPNILHTEVYRRDKTKISKGTIRTPGRLDALKKEKVRNTGGTLPLLTAETLVGCGNGFPIGFQNLSGEQPDPYVTVEGHLGLPEQRIRPSHVPQCLCYNAAFLRRGHLMLT